MDIDDTFTPDNAWSTTLHDNDYSDAGSLRMGPADVVTAADWSIANNFRMDQLFNFGGSVEYQNCELGLPADTCPAGKTSIADPLLAEFQATDPLTNKSYADDFGWLSHTYDTPYLDVGCATTDYIEAELNENTADAAAKAGTTAGTGGLGLTSSTNAALALGYQNPASSCRATLRLRRPRTRYAGYGRPTDLDSAAASATGTLAVAPTSTR